MRDANVYVLGAARTPIGKIMGGLTTLTAPQLLRNARFGYRLGPATLQHAAIHDGLGSPWDEHHGHEWHVARHRRPEPPRAARGGGGSTHA